MILYQELKQFKKDIMPHCKVSIDVIDYINNILSATYEQLLPEEIPQDTVLLLADIRHSINNAKHNIQHIISSISLIGADQHDRYFNVVDGKIVETDREHYTGPLDDDDDSTSGAMGA